MLKVVHLTSVHPPFDTRIFHKECKSLAAAGYEVVLVAPHDRDEVVEGVRLRPITKASGRWRRMTETAGAAYRAALAEDAAVYHFHDPELIPVGLLLKQRGKRVIYDVHEDLPRQVLNKLWIPAGVRALASTGAAMVEAVAAARFDRFVGATGTITRRFPFQRAVTIHNFPWLAELVADAGPAYADRPANVGYIGAIYPSRGAVEMVDAIASVPDATLVLAGEIRPPGFVDTLSAMPGWGRTEFLGWQDRAQLKAMLSRARLGLVTLHPTPSYLESYPIKLFEYMAAGLPFVASDFPLWREILEGCEAGLFVDPLDSGAIARAIAWLLEHPAEAEAMGRRGREAVERRFNWEAESQQLLALYAGLLL